MRFEPIPNLLDRVGAEGSDSAGASAGTTSNAIEKAPSSLSLFLGPLGRLLEDPEVTEICINEPGAAFVERQSGWSREDLPFASYDWCLAIAKLVANFTR